VGARQMDAGYGNEHSDTETFEKARRCHSALSRPEGNFAAARPDPACSAGSVRRVRPGATASAAARHEDLNRVPAIEECRSL
jgi:hypothetical protein